MKGGNAANYRQEPKGIILVPEQKALWGEFLPKKQMSGENSRWIHFPRSREMFPLAINDFATKKGRESRENVVFHTLFKVAYNV